MKRPILEIFLAAGTGLGKFIFMDWLQWRLSFVVVALGFWLGYVIIQARRNKQQLHQWGFRTDNFASVLKRVLPFGIAAVLISIATGYFRDTLNFTWHVIPILLIYPLWGTIQQFLIMGLVAGNLQDQGKLKPWLVIIISAALFGIVHYPWWWLILGTTCLAVFYTYVYLKERNLYVLGLFHGWLGAIFYYTILGRDPFLEMFGQLL